MVVHGSAASPAQKFYMGLHVMQGGIRRRVSQSRRAAAGPDDEDLDALVAPYPDHNDLV
jgi:hypothetical protein